MNQNRVDRGVVAEIIVLAELTKNGYKVSLPVSHGLPYDLIVDTGTSLRKVQVKRSYVSNVRGKMIRKVETCRIIGKKAVKYKIGDYDVMVAVDVENNNFWVLPYKSIQDYSRQIELTSSKVRFMNDWTLI